MGNTWYEGWEEYEEYKHPVLEKHKALLEKFIEDRVFSIGHDKDDGIFFVAEQCDEWFSHNLTKDECLELSELFKEIADEMK